VFCNSFFYSKESVFRHGNLHTMLSIRESLQDGTNDSTTCIRLPIFFNTNRSYRTLWPQTTNDSTICIRLPNWT